MVHATVVHATVVHATVVHATVVHATVVQRSKPCSANSHVTGDWDLERKSQLPRGEVNSGTLGSSKCFLVGLASSMVSFRKDNREF